MKRNARFVRLQGIGGCTLGGWRSHESELCAGVLEMSGSHTQRKKCLAAPAIVGEAAILTKQMPELSSR